MADNQQTSHTTTHDTPHTRCFLCIIPLDADLLILRNCALCVAGAWGVVFVLQLRSTGCSGPCSHAEGGTIVWDPRRHGRTGHVGRKRAAASPPRGGEGGSRRRKKEKEKSTRPCFAKEEATRLRRDNEDKDCEEDNASSRHNKQRHFPFWETYFMYVFREFSTIEPRQTETDAHKTKADKKRSEGAL